MNEVEILNQFTTQDFSFISCAVACFIGAITVLLSFKIFKGFSKNERIIFLSFVILLCVLGGMFLTLYIIKIPINKYTIQTNEKTSVHYFMEHYTIQTSLGNDKYIVTKKE